MNRRNFLNTALLTGLASTFSTVISVARSKMGTTCRGTLSMNKNRVSIYTNVQVKPTRIFHITDTHLSINDERGIQYSEFSKRMAGAYKQNTHFQTTNEITTKESFEQTLQIAIEQKVDFLALTGDILSFPSHAAVEWILQKLNSTKIPFAYVAGNHDWHFEGMNGSSQQLREIWTNKILNPLYQANNPLYAAYNLNGICFVCIDNSTYEILPEQLDFLKTQIKSEIPFVLLMHIPLYMPGRTMGYGCANPNWGEESDKNFNIERREKWRSGGHTKVTIKFYDEVFNAPNLLTILAGHTHRPAIDVKNGIPQIVSGHNATGYFTDVNIDSI